MIKQDNNCVKTLILIPKPILSSIKPIITINVEEKLNRATTYQSKIRMRLSKNL